MRKGEVFSSPVGFLGSISRFFPLYGGRLRRCPGCVGGFSFGFALVSARTSRSKRVPLWGLVLSSSRLAILQSFELAEKRSRREPFFSPHELPDDLAFFLGQVAAPFFDVFPVVAVASLKEAVTPSSPLVSDLIRSCRQTMREIVSDSPTSALTLLLRSSLMLDQLLEKEVSMVP